MASVYARGTCRYTQYSDHVSPLTSRANYRPCDLHAVIRQRVRAKAAPVFTSREFRRTRTFSRFSPELIFPRDPNVFDTIFIISDDLYHSYSSTAKGVKPCRRITISLAVCTNGMQIRLHDVVHRGASSRVEATREKTSLVIICIFFNYIFFFL